MSSRTLHEWIKRRLAFITMKVRRGPLQGKLWNVTSGIKFISGEYEPEKTEAIVDLINPADVAFDLGAHVGYFTVLMSDCVGPGGKVVSFEPRDINFEFLQQHVRINHCDNVETMNVGVGDRTGAARLETRMGTGRGYVSPDGNTDVRMVVLDELIQSGEVPVPQFLKIDVEGFEMEVLEGAKWLIETHRPKMVLATHTPALEKACDDWLSARGYEMKELQILGDTEWTALPIEGAAATPLAKDNRA